ncbi:MAG: hypothetical protein EHM70_04650 [Chloroflexota bacterium]|nr:MAG: hypothetical protein EHM70_04650 [Chloroflexota bacterium]
MLLLAGTFLFLYALALTLSPAASGASDQEGLLWEHWLPFGLWVVLFTAAHFLTSISLPGRDPYLLPIAALLSGWGILTIYRLTPYFGRRQTLWLFVAVALFLTGLRLPTDLGFLRRYKYLLLTTGLLLTGLTLLLGTNPSGDGLPRLWLGGFGIYVQPSEPLKLLLIVYLASYLAGSGKGITLSLLPLSNNLLPLLAPTILMTGIALLLLIIQRDLGTASIFLFLYAAIVYIVLGRKEILWMSAVAILVAGIAGYLLFDVVRIRIDAWLNPWVDPSGRSYQIVQSLLSVAHGGLLGRGPGMGYPWLVPVPHSDFIFTAIVEENGLVGGLGLLVLIGLMANRGLRAAINAPDAYRRYLAAGLTALLVFQSILIIGGNLRLLPLTGVTLPFVSYGGSSLLTSFLLLAVLLHISNQGETSPALFPASRAYMHLGFLLLAGVAAAGLVTGWWAFYRGPDLLTRTDNPRRAISDLYVQRGTLYDRNNTPLAATHGERGSYARQSLYPPLGPVVGYTHPVYGQSGVEASLDPYLRGIQGNPGFEIWWNHLLYGQPPGGVDVRLTLDVQLQRVADELLGDRLGAVALINAHNGDILVLASHPTFDPNALDTQWDALVTDERSPLFNRATMGQYQPGAGLGPLLLSASTAQGTLPPLPQILSYKLNNEDGPVVLSCAQTPPAGTWQAAIAAGCPGPAAALGLKLAGDDPGSLVSLYARFGLYTAPAIRLPADSAPLPTGPDDLERQAIGQADLRASPLQMAIAAAALSAGGVRPAPRLVIDIDNAASGPVILPLLSEPVQVIPAEAANDTALLLAVPGLPIWQIVAVSLNGPGQSLTWYIGGTLPDQSGAPVTLVLVLEENDPAQAVEIGQSILIEATE